MSRIKRKITNDEIEQVERMAGLGLTMDQISRVIGISKDSLERRSNETAALKSAISRGRANASLRVMETAYQLATSGECPSMTMFWLKTRCQWQERSSVDHTLRPVTYVTSIQPDGNLLQQMIEEVTD
jgi:uncharacterized protein (DUF2384 family)